MRRVCGRLLVARKLVRGLAKTSPAQGAGFNFWCNEFVEGVDT